MFVSSWPADTAQGGVYRAHVAVRRFIVPPGQALGQKPPVLCRYDRSVGRNHIELGFQARGTNR